MKILYLVLLLTGAGLTAIAQHSKVNEINSGIPWFDDRGKVVSAHGANIVSDHRRYYLFGEAHYDNSNAFAGFNCYSSSDLYNWKFEKVCLAVQDSGRLGPDRIGERPKVLKCPATGEYVMLMHTDDLGYKDPCIGYATASTITGPYTFRGPLLFNGDPIKKWDMGSFQDMDGSGYLMLHGGLLYKLSDDYHTISKLVADNKWRGCESPAMIKKGGVYFWLTSDLTSWEKNDNVYYTAASLKGPWTLQGNIAPKGTLTWNSQTSFVLAIAGVKDTTYMFMGDRWSYPKQASAATYVWQPLKISGTSMSMPKFMASWQINSLTGKTVSTAPRGHYLSVRNKKYVFLTGNWIPVAGDGDLSSNEKNAAIAIKFAGTQISLAGVICPDGGYASIALTDSKGRELFKILIDTYCKYSTVALLYKTPLLASGNYILKITVLGEHGNWSDKAKNMYGSTGNFINLTKFIIAR